MKIFSYYLMVACCVLISLNSHANVSKIKDVASRVAPWMKGKVVTEIIPSSDGMDVFEISTKNGKLIIKANSVPAAGMGLNYYLKHMCKRHYALVGKNMAPIDDLPELKIPIRKESPFEYRHIFNFCTQNYSASFWGWKEWEEVIDFMVLNGVNLTLASLGTEKLWSNTLEQFNFTKDEILNFLPGPAYNAWHMMANLEGWGGPITDRMIDNRAKLQQKIVKRLREYEIEPIYPCFYGMVPSTLHDKYPDANIIDQGYWVGGFKRPSVLVPSDDLYKEMADVYYTELKKLYGEFNYFAGEPFHEGGHRGDIDVSELAVDVQSGFRKHNKGAIWVLQGWSGNPTPKFLSKLSKEDDVLIWDFRGELSNEWETSKGYYGYPYFWGVINNYGDTPGLYGRLERFNNELFRAKDGPYGKNLKGLSIAPEGILNNPVNFDLMYEIAWGHDKVDVQKWVDNYTEYRYGKSDENMKAVWEILLQSAYSSDTDPSLADPISNALPSIVGNGESILAAAPALDLTCASSWGTSKLFYDYKKLKAIIPLLLESIDEFKDVESFRFDVVDFTRQLISNDFRVYYDVVNKAIKEKDIATFNEYSEKMLSLLLEMESVLATHPDFMLGKWVNMAIDQAKGPYEEKLYEFNAKSLISYWGKDHPSTDLRDYSFKEWAGIVKDLHYPRWKLFLDYHKNILEGNSARRINNTGYSIEWAKKRIVYPDTPQSDFAETTKRVLRSLEKDM